MKKKYLYILFILFPFLDLITALLVRNLNLTITPGVIVKSLFMLIMVFYVLFSKSKYKKLTITAYIIYFVYMILYFIFKPELLSTSFLFSELTHLYKLLYFPMIFLGLLCFFDEYTFDKKEIKKIMFISLISMTVLLIVPIILNVAYSTYHNNLKGVIGWFYAGNDVSNVMILLYPFAVFFIKGKIKYYIFVIPIIFSIFMIGTKVSLWGLLIINVINVIYFILKEKTIKSNKVLISVLVLIVCFLVAPYSYTTINTKTRNVKKVEKIEIDENNIEEVNLVLEKLNKFYDKDKINKQFKKLLSGRDKYLANTLSIYNNDKSASNMWFGIGFSNTKSVNNSKISKLIEIDLLDALFHLGVIGVLIMFSPYFIVLYLIVFSKNKITLDSIYFAIISVLIFCISTFSGHVYATPSVSFYVIVFLLLILSEFRVIGNNLSTSNES